MAGGFAVAAAGFAVLATIDATSHLAVLLVGAGVVACGTVAILTLVTDYVLGVAPPERAGSVSGLFETTSELGGALGMAVLGSVLAAGYTSHVSGLLPEGLPPAAEEQARESIAGSLSVAGSLPGQTGEAVLEAGRTAYLSGMRVTEVVAALAMLAMALLTGALLRGGGGVPAPAREKELDPHAA
jgi:DHA2 family multidrug resistance protein-like MFS transporter